jgi:glycosyltransferase involved in cell wall biosynthesis
MTIPKITIITPSYQQGQFLERTVQSVLTQGVVDLEYWVMDGGSTDDSVAVLKRYETALRWVSERDGGQAHAVNKGLQQAQGEIIGWLNSDDVYYPNALPSVLAYFAAHPDVDVVYGDANHIDAFDSVIALYPTESWNVDRLKKTCYLSQPAVFFRRRILAQSGMLNEKLNFCMDYEFWMRLGLSGIRFAYLPQVLAGSRLHDQTKTLSAPLKAHREAISMLRDKIGYAPATWLITYAVALVKAKTTLRSPQWRYLVSVWLVAAMTSVQTNGVLRGLMSLVTLPFAMLSLKRSDAVRV